MMLYSYQLTDIKCCVTRVSQQSINHITVMFIPLYVYNCDIVFLHLHVAALQVLQHTPY